MTSIIGSVVLSAVFSAGPEIHVPWFTDISEARQKALSEKKPLVLIVHIDATAL
jgi:hypothetical protein